MRKGRLAPLALLLAAACADRGPPVWAPTPELDNGSTEACARAKSLRDRAPALLEAGRMDRAIRVLTRAEELCPREAPATWAPRVTALAAIGRAAEAMQLAARIDRSDRASDEDRKAAAAARAIAEAHGRAVIEAGRHANAPELFDPNQKRRADADALLHRAASAARAGDHKTAKQLYLDAWTAWHPSPAALVGAGIAARALGEGAEAQRLFDRAAYDDSGSAVRPEIPQGAPSLLTGSAALAWSADGARLAIGGDEEIAVFDAALHPTLRIHNGEAVAALAFDADEARLFAGLDGMVRVYDALTGALLRTLEGMRGPVRALAASPDRQTFAAGGDDGFVRLWDALSGAALRSLKLAKPAAHLAFDATGARLAAAGTDGKIALFDGKSGALLATLPARGGAVRALAFDRDALVVVTAQQELRWDLADPKRPRATSTTRARSDEASIAVDASRVLVAELAGAAPDKPARGAKPPPTPASAEITVKELASTASLTSVPAAAHGGVLAFALAPGGRTLALVHRDRTLALVPTGGGERRELSPSPAIDALAAAPGAKALAAAAAGRVFLWRASGDRLRALDTDGARALSFSPDTRTLAIGLAGAHLIVRDLDGRRADLVLDTAGPVSTVSFSPDGMRIAAGSAALVELWSAGGGAPQKLNLDAAPVRTVRFTPDGANLLVAGKDGVTYWDPQRHGGLRFVPYGPDARDLALFPDGSGMVVVDQRGLLLFGKPAPSAPAPTATVPVSGSVVAIAVARDGTIATAEGDRAISLRSPTGKAFHRFRDPDGAVQNLAFFPAHVAAGLGDGSVRLYKGPDTGPAAILRVLSGLGPKALAGVIMGPRGQLELVGPDAEAAKGALRCRLGAALYPFEVCAEQFVVDGVLDLVLAGKDPAEADP
jgi:WD40 repeat protein